MSFGEFRKVACLNRRRMEQQILHVKHRHLGFMPASDRQRVSQLASRVPKHLPDTEFDAAPTCRRLSIDNVSMGNEYQQGWLLRRTLAL